MNIMKSYPKSTGIPSLSCIAPVGYLNYSFRDEALLRELELLNGLSKYLMPNILYLASRYVAKNKKESRRGMFAPGSVFTEDILLPLLEKFTSFEGEDFVLSKAALWSFVHKAGLSFLQSQNIIINKAASLSEKMEFSEWGRYVNRVYDNVSNSFPYSPFFIFPASVMEGDILSRAGATINMMSDTAYRLSLEDAEAMLTFNQKGKVPSFAAISISHNGLIFSFIFDFSNSGGAKELYAFSNHIHQEYPEILNYRYNGKASPFYYPVVYTPPVSHKLR